MAQDVKRLANRERCLVIVTSACQLATSTSHRCFFLIQSSNGVFGLLKEGKFGTLTNSVTEKMSSKKAPVAERV